MQERNDTKQFLSILKDVLNKDEQVVIQLLVESKGKIAQNTIAQQESMNRVKAHRTVKALQERGVLHTEKIGKRIYVHLDKPILQKLQPHSSKELKQTQ